MSSSAYETSKDVLKNQLQFQAKDYFLFIVLLYDSRREINTISFINISTKKKTALHMRSQKRALIEKLVEGFLVLDFTYSNCLSKGVNVIVPVQYPSIRKSCIRRLGVINWNTLESNSATVHKLCKRHLLAI